MKPSRYTNSPFHAVDEVPEDVVLSVNSYAAEMLAQMPQRAPRHEHNPFIDGLTIRAKRSQLSKPEAADKFRNDDGEKLTLESRVVRYVDREEFTKIFATASAAALNLSPAGAKVLLLYQALLRPGNVDIFLKWEEPEWDIPGHPHAHIELSRSTFYRGLKDLIENNFLAHTSRNHWYWVNPAFIYRGDRVRLVREYVIGKRDAGDCCDMPKVIDP